MSHLETGCNTSLAVTIDPHVKVTPIIGPTAAITAADEEVLAPGFEGVFLVLVPLGRVAVMGAGGGETIPAGGVIYADGDGAGCQVEGNR